MLPWWGWVLLWVALMVAGAALLGWRGWRVWGKVKALSREVRAAERTLTALGSERDRLAGTADVPPEKLAIFSDPARVGRERVATRDTLRQERRARARARRPGWARSVD